MRFELVAFAALCYFAGIASCAERDWVKNPAVVQVETNGEIFAIGDAHSDYARLASVMLASGLITSVPDKPEDVRWNAGVAVLVTTGDMIDKGPRGVDVLRLLHALQVSARAKHGRVIVLAGNHEAEFMADSAAPKGHEFAAQLIAAGLRPADVAACKTDIGEFLCSLPFAARVNDWFFSHGGNTGGRSLAQVDGDIQLEFAKHGYGAPQLIGDDSLLEARLNGKKGVRPWIDDGLPKRSEKELLADYTSALGVKHIVEGHVPSEVRFTDGVVREPGEMFQRFGTLFLIDTGMSEGVGDSHGAVLRITANDATAICPDGKRTLLWESRNAQDIGRAAPCGK